MNDGMQDCGFHSYVHEHLGILEYGAVKIGRRFEREYCHRLQGNPNIPLLGSAGFVDTSVTLPNYKTSY